jgi:hypothetical protein
MIEFIVVVVVVILIAVVFHAIEQNKIRKQLLDSFNGSHAGWETYVSSTKKILSISPDGSEVALGNATTPTLYPIAAVVTVEVLRDGASLTQTNRGSQAAGALIGGLALGGAGLLLGGLSGSKRSTNTVNSISIKIIVDDRTTPVHLIEFFQSPSKKGTESRSILLQQPIAAADKFHALLVTAMRKATPAANQYVALPEPKNSTADELRKLWDLRQAGALSDEEFATHKSRLLGTGITASG